MNVHDSLWLTAALEKNGLVAVDLADAQIIIINTCSVRHKPEAKLYSALGRIGALTEANPNVCVAVCGCVAQQLGAKIFDYSPQVRLVAGSDGIAGMPEALLKLLDSPFERLARLDFAGQYVERPPLEIRGASAYVAIMQGCDNFCAYCIVPFTRGRQKSRHKKEILEECRRRAGAGAVEITLLGQNVNAWGKDNAQGAFADLLEDIASISGIERIRYVTPHPADMTQADIEAFGGIDALCPRLHLPLQAGSDRILASMRRRYTRNSYLRLVDSLRKARPDIALSTDIIVGFPGEMEEDFLQTLSMLRECAFMSSFSFCYSDRPGARASLFPDKIDPQIMHERLYRFQELQEQLSQAWLAKRIGGKTRVLVEGKSPRLSDGHETWQGRDEYGMIVHLELPGSSDYVGRFVNCEIEKAKRHSLVGRMVK